MSLIPSSSLARISFAIALSLALHGLLIFSVPIEPPAPIEPPLPPLLAKLEPLPTRVAAPKPVRPKPRPKPARPAPVAATPVTPSEPPAADAAAEPSSTELADAGNAAAVPELPAETVVAAPPAPPAHPLPKHAQLKFTVYKGTSFIIGEAVHRLEVSDDQHYVLSVNVNTTGLVGLFKKFNLTQTSTGRYHAIGLQPEKFSEAKMTSSGKEVIQADFAWATETLNFSSGISVPLPSQSQDFVSFLYQLSQLDVTQDALTMSISNGKKLERYQLEIGEPQEINSGLGTIMAIPFRKIHAPHEEGLEVWLGVAYRLLPVKISQLDRDGTVLGEMVVSEIRLSDE